MAEGDRPCVICVRSADIRDGVVVTGSYPGTCERCGASVQVSASGRTFVADRAAMILCSQCATEFVSDTTELIAVPGAIEELMLDPALSSADKLKILYLMWLLDVKDGSARPPQPHEPPQ